MSGAQSEPDDEDRDTITDRGTVSATNRDPSDESEVKAMDRYGFLLLVGSTFHQRKAITNQFELQSRKNTETNREKKWLKMLRRWEFTQIYRSSKLQRRVRKGIPDGLRGVMWYKILEMAAYSVEQKTSKMTLKHRYPNVYDITCVQIDKIPMQTLDEIDRDVDRTYPSHIFFRDDGGPGQESLRKVLRWYAAIDAEVGYCQGMGFIAGLLLTYMPEDTAFYSFGALMQHIRGPLRELYLPGLIEAKKKLYVFEQLMKMYIPKIAMHFEACGVFTTMFAAEWILTIFCRGFSFDLVTRIIDIYALEGFKIIYRVALALLKNIEKDLLKSSFEAILATLRTVQSTVDAVEIIQVAWTIPLKSADITKLEIEYMAVGERAHTI